MKPLRRTQMKQLVGMHDGISGTISPDLRGVISLDLHGDISGLRGVISLDLHGDISGLRGAISSDLRGNISDLRGDLSDVQGNCDEIPHDARPCTINDWIEA